MKDIFFHSTQKLYQRIKDGKVKGFTVPAFNLRTLTYDTARALFRAAKKNRVGAFIIELAESEIDYTKQSLKEYAGLILKASVKEKFEGPLFLQGDHFKIKGNFKDLKRLIKKAIKSGFYNIDIDGSLLSLKENFKQTAEFASIIRKLEPKNLTVSIGGEVGVVGGRNTTLFEFEEFIKGFDSELLGYRDFKGLSKIAVQTGTAHGKGGEVDFQLLKILTAKAKEYGIAGVVQHGASTLSEQEFKKFPEVGVLEIHLATEFQNIILKSSYFPQGLKEKIYSKKDFGFFKKEISNIPQKDIDKICEELEEKFSFFFRNLNVCNTSELIQEIYN